MNWLKKLFKIPLKSHLLEDKYKVSQAFEHDGKKYYHFEDAMNMPAGRALCALAIYEELRMRCSREYLEKHCKATEIILSDPKKINIQAIAIMNKNLRERLDLVPFPDHVFKLASVTFFDESESPYFYDWKYNLAKIKKWEKDPEMLSFFLKRLLPDLIPSLESQGINAGNYSHLLGMINEIHLTEIREQLSKVN